MRAIRRRTGVVSVVMAVGLHWGLGSAVWAGDIWTAISDFDATCRLWDSESGRVPQVRVTGDQAHSGSRSLAIDIGVCSPGVLRQTWGVDVDDLKWSLDSRIRFWIKGGPLAQRPHGGLLFIEAGGKKDGGPSHWFLPIPGETYGKSEWHEVVLPPLRQASNPDWAPDADKTIDPNRIVRLLFVAQQEASPELNRPFTVYMDDVEASGVASLPIAYSDATIEARPRHVTPIWRGFKGRVREHKPLVTFAEVQGWRVAQYGGMVATMVRSEEEPCHEDLRHQAKLTFHSRSGGGRFELVPPRPISISTPFNAVCSWVYGNNWAWVADATPLQVNPWLRISDATGQRHRIDLSTINFKFYGWLSKRLRQDPSNDPGHVFWGGAADGRIHLPAALEAIEFRGAANREPSVLYIESVAVYQDDMSPPTFRPELIENMPFPTTPDTILPTLEKPCQTAVSREGATFVLTGRGDETVVWRYTPASGTLSDLTAEVSGRAAIRPGAGGGPALRLDGRDREPSDPAMKRELLSAALVGASVESVWRYSVGTDAAEIRLRLTARGKSMIADWSSPQPKAVALRVGRVEGAVKPKLIRVPYLNINNDGPGILLAGETFVSTLLDWYHTESSGFHSSCRMEGDAAIINDGALYHPLTDGTRNLLGERQFINVSSRFEEVLPNIPNPPSTQSRVTRTHLYCHLGGVAVDRFDGWLGMWQRYHRMGIEKVMVSHHEDAWTNGADVGQGGQEYTMCIEAAPEVGDERLIAYCRAMRRMGYYIGLYENFTDYNPLGKSWDVRNAVRDSQGNLMRVWPPTYAIRPLKALEMAMDYPRRVAAKFGVNTAYRDCHTAYPPWGQVDFQAGTPGAGKFAMNFKAWGALLRDGHKAYGGPIFSEGGYHWFSAGLVDGNYGQIWMPNAVDYPLLLEFDLRKLHPLEADISMTPGWNWGPGGFWQGLAATIAYGHIGFQPFGELADAARYYYLMQQLQSRYVMIPVEEIRYHHQGRFHDITDALKVDAHRTNQVRVRYKGGLEVAVNYNAGQRWSTTVGGKPYDLSSYGWAAIGGDGFVEYCTELDGRRIGFVDSPVYCFADAGGKRYEFGRLGCDGMVVIRKDDPRGNKIIPITSAGSISLEAPEGANLEAYDATDRPRGRVQAKREGTRLMFIPVKDAEYYLLTSKPS